MDWEGQRVVERGVLPQHPWVVICRSSASRAASTPCRAASAAARICSYSSFDVCLRDPQRRRRGVGPLKHASERDRLFSGTTRAPRHRYTPKLPAVLARVDSYKALLMCAKCHTKILEWQRSRTGQMAPVNDAIVRLCTIPGVSHITAWGLLADVGTDMSRFPSAQHLASWAGLCPGQNESAGKRRNTRTRRESVWMRRCLCQCAWAVSHKKATYLSSLYRRLRLAARSETSRGSRRQNVKARVRADSGSVGSGTAGNRSRSRLTGISLPMDVETTPLFPAFGLPNPFPPVGVFRRPAPRLEELCLPCSPCGTPFYS